MAASDALIGFDKLLHDLVDTVVPNLGRFPEMGRRFLDRPAGSMEATSGLQKLTSSLGAGVLREYLHKEFLILYLQESERVSLLAIKHHRQFSFDFEQLWSRGG